MNTKFRKARVEKNSERTFSLKDENFRSIISDVYNEINNKYRKLITGMQGFNQLIGGGFENTRAYLLIGMTGVGKSLTLLDLAYQMKKYNKDFQPKDPTKIPCIVYLTMENTVAETVQRLFQMSVGSEIDMKDYSVDEVVHLMQANGELFLTDDSPIDIIIKFRPNRSEDTSYLYTLTEDLEDEGYEVICMIQDHVKRIKSVEYQTDVRLELGNVINEMKTFAMIKDIPIITVSHVNREGARVIDNMATSTKTDLTRMLGKAFIGESMLMLDNVDFASMINKEYDSEGRKYMVFNCVKHRFKINRGYVCIPFIPDNDIRLIEDYYSPIPLFKETLSDVPKLNNGQMNNTMSMPHNRFTSSEPIIEDSGEVLMEFIKRASTDIKEDDIKPVTVEEPKPVIYRPIVFYDHEEAI